MEKSAGQAEEHADNFRTSAVLVVGNMLGGIVTDVMRRQLHLQQTALRCLNMSSAEWRIDQYERQSRCIVRLLRHVRWTKRFMTDGWIPEAGFQQTLQTLP